MPCIITLVRVSIANQELSVYVCLFLINPVVVCLIVVGKARKERRKLLAFGSKLRYLLTHFTLLLPRDVVMVGDEYMRLHPLLGSTEDSNYMHRSKLFLLLHSTLAATACQDKMYEIGWCLVWKVGVCARPQHPECPSS